MSRNGIALGISLFLHIFLLILILGGKSGGGGPGSGNLPPGNQDVIIVEKREDQDVGKKGPGKGPAPKKVEESCKQSFGGIGVEYQLDGLITTVYAGYPAAAIGLLEGDIIRSSLKEIRGEIGSDVTVLIQRGVEMLPVTMTRAKICIEDMKPGGKR